MKHTNILYCLLLIISCESVCQNGWWTSLGNWAQRNQQKIALGAIATAVLGLACYYGYTNYCAASKQQTPAPVQPQQNLPLFAQEEYEKYMHLIEQLDLRAYQRLQVCQNLLGRPCILRRNRNDKRFIEPPSSKTKGYPIILLPAHITRSLAGVQEEILKRHIQKYNEHPTIAPITHKERQQVFDLIASIAPDLYKEMIAADPNGTQHIFRSYTSPLSVQVNINTGLPAIFVDQYILQKYPVAYLQAGLAHELGHYKLKHLLEDISPGKTQLGHMLARAKQRTLEYEADRSEVLDFGIDIQIAKDALEALEVQESGSSLKSTHPFVPDRIRQFDALYREIPLKKDSRKIDWKTLADEYKKAFNSKKSQFITDIIAPSKK